MQGGLLMASLPMQGGLLALGVLATLSILIWELLTLRVPLCMPPWCVGCGSFLLEVGIMGIFSLAAVPG